MVNCRMQVCRIGLGAVLSIAMLLTGCGSTRNRAPVEDRPAALQPAAPDAAVVAEFDVAGSTAYTAIEPVKLLPGAENAGKPGYYSIKPGDTMIRIGLESGQNWKDLVKWNNLDNPNLIEVGQVLRIVAPGQDPALATPRPVAAAKVETKALDVKPVAIAAGPSTASAAAASATVANPLPSASPALPAATSAAAVAPAPPREGDDDVNWQWPSAGSLAGGFEDGKSKGLLFAGKAGDPVLAAADGRVVYAGSGLRGYGNLVILKHNNTYLTAYAHNQSLLVKEDQAVRRGQRIAEMGATDAERVQLHFEIRRQGKPVDPSKLLPPR